MASFRFDSQSFEDRCFPRNRRVRREIRGISDHAIGIGIRFASRNALETPCGHPPRTADSNGRRKLALTKRRESAKSAGPRALRPEERIMYSAGISILTALAMLLHGILGCCWHHAHECCGNDEGGAACQCAPTSSDRADGAVAECGRASHSHGCSHDSDSGSDADDAAEGVCSDCRCHDGDSHRPGACAEQHCSFVPSRSLELPELLPVTGVVPVDFHVETSALVNAYGQDRRDLYPPPTDAARRALTQVWRI